MKTLVLLSGGLDSTTVLAGCVASHDECLAVGFDYGQVHSIELERARTIADYYAVPFELVVLPIIPKVNDLVFAGRNLVMASIAIAMAQARGFDRIAVGCNENDWLHFPDCRPAFWRDLANCASAYGVKVSTPFVNHGKRDIVAAARNLKVPIDLTWSCYAPRDSRPCLQCLACKTRQGALEMESLTP